MTAPNSHATCGSIRDTALVIAAGAFVFFSALTAQAQVTNTFTEPLETLELSAAESGLVASVEVREGQRTKRGELLGQLDSRVLQQTRRMAKRRSESMGKINAAKADLALMQRRLSNLRPLQEEGHANPNELADAEAEVQRAKANLEVALDAQAEQEIELSRIDAQLAQREIRSPVDGVILQLHRKVGEYLTISEPRFATIARLTQLRAKFFIETCEAERLREGGSVRVLLGSSLQGVPARVDFVAPVTDSQSGTVRVDVLIENADLKHRSGIRCELVLPAHDAPLGG